MRPQMAAYEEEPRSRARGQHRLPDPGLDVLDLAGENVDHGIHERQLIAQLRGVLLDELERQTGRRNAFDSLFQASHLLERFLRPFAAPDAHAVELVAPGQPRHFEVADAREAECSHFVGALRGAEDGHLPHGLVKCGRLEVVVRNPGLLLEAVSDAERDREDVLHGSADFHAGFVVGGLDGVVVGANCARVLDGDVEVLAPEDGRGGFPRGALVRLHGTRDGDDRGQVVVALVRRDASDRVGQQEHVTVVELQESLGGHHEGVGFDDTGQRHFHDLLDADGSHGNDDGIRAFQGLVEGGVGCAE